ncbi:MAG: DUF192 domain-containing protein [Pararhodobacter sp.]|nr:DUF192 domain-containing protein [Pararhodobacter sp.]
MRRWVNSGKTAGNLFLAGLFLAVSVSAALAQAACRDDAVHLRGAWGQARFAVELADDPQSRAQGLMFRETLPRSAGMLFIFDRPDRAVFWMENTLIPLDMLFIDPSGVVRHIHRQARPLDRTPIDGGENVLMVLEINGGLSDRLGINTGSELRHPRLDQAHAAWPCAE